MAEYLHGQHLKDASVVIVRIISKTTGLKEP